MNAEDKTILFVEDEEFYRRPLTEKLRLSGYNVLEATDGKAGHDQALQHHPDLIVLDIVLTGFDGLTILRMLREDEWGKHVPVIILTNLRPDDADIQKAISESQPVYFMSKVDHSLDDVVDKITEYIATNTKS